jgi:hypothetical protein
MYACNGYFCTFKAHSKKSIKWHVIRHHLPLESVPFHCSVCKYRAKIKSQLLRHFESNNYKKHQLVNVDNLTTEECMVMLEPAYNATFSYDCSGDVQILPDSSNVNPSDVPPVFQSTVQKISVPGPLEIAAPSTSIYTVRQKLSTTCLVSIISFLIMKLFQIGLLFSLPVHTYLFVCETGY